MNVSSTSETTVFPSSVSPNPEEIIGPIQWSDNCLLGVPLIDNQHKRLFGLVEELRVFCYQQKSQDIIVKTLQGLLAYCNEHFESEELLMRVIDYSSLDEHAEIHRNFVLKSYEMFTEFKEGTLNPKYTLQVLRDWLVHHVLNSDKKIAEYCQEHHIRVTSVHTVSDLITLLHHERKWWHKPQMFAPAVAVLFIPHLVAILWLGYWRADSYNSQIIAASVAVALVLVFDLILFQFIQSNIKEQIRKGRISHAQQLAENLIAGEVAKRIEVMDLEGLETLFNESDGYLLHTLKKIVLHLRKCVPYLPSALISLMRTDPSVSIADLEEDGKVGSEEVVSSCSAECLSERSNRTRGSTAVTFTKPRRLSFHDMEGDILTSGSVDITNTKISTEKLLISPLAMAGLDLPSSRSLRSGGSTSPHHHDQSTTPRSPTNAIQQGSGGGVNPRAMAYSKASRKSLASSSHPQLLDSARGGKLDMLDVWLLRKSITLLGCTISDFNSILLTKTPVEILDFHSKYIKIIEDVCKATKAVFGNMSGDQAFLSWNTVYPIGNHAEQGCHAALKLQESYGTLTGNSSKLAIGISSANVLVGNMGSRTKIGFSILGSLPSFVESLCELNSYFHTEILVSFQTWKDVKDLFLGKLVAPVDTVKPEPFPFPFPTTSATVQSPNGTTTRVARLPSTTLFTTRHMSTVSGVSSSYTSTQKKFVVELKSAISQSPVSEEWMYAIEGAKRKDPYAEFNELLLNVFNWSTSSCSNSEMDPAVVEANRNDLKAKLHDYVTEHCDDTVASVTHTLCDQLDGITMIEGSWKCGWSFSGPGSDLQ